MPVVWQNSFDGTPGDLVSNDLAGPGTSGDHGDPIVNLRNTGEVEYVRYGAQAIHGSASLALGAEDAFSGNHGDVQLTQELTEWSISFYLYRSDGGWVRILQDGRVNVTDLYLDYSSGDHFVGWDELDSDATDEMVDRWVRCEARHVDDEITWRFWWTDPESTGTADYEINLSADNVTGYLFVQGGGANADHPPAYLDSIQVGDGEWIGPWPADPTGTAELAATGQVSAAGVKHATGTAALEATGDLAGVAMPAPVWQNTLDGPDGVEVTVENSGDHGDELRLVVQPAAYTDDWTAAGDGAVQVGPGEDLSGIVADPGWSAIGEGSWAIRLYLMVPQGGTLHVAGLAGLGSTRGFVAIEDDNNRYDINGYDASDYASGLIGQTVRLEVYTEGSEDDIIARLWWSDPHSTGEADLEVAAQMSSAWTLDEIHATAPADLGHGYVDEIAISDAAVWIGPVATDQHETGTAQVAGEGLVSGSGTKAATAIAGVSGEGAVSTTGTKAITGGVHLSVEGDLDATGAKGLAADVHLGAEATVSATGRKDTTATVELAATGSLQAEGTGVPVYAARLGGEGEVSAAGSKHATGDVHLVAAPTLGATGHKGIRGQTTLSGEATVAGAGYKPEAHTGQAHLAAEATLEGQGTGLVEGEGFAHLGAEGGLSASGRKGIRGQAHLSADAALEAMGPPPLFPPTVSAEIRLDGEWVDITEDVRTREPVQITRGRADEAAEADPSGCTLLLNNRHGRYSPHNPMSPYYGQLRRNTPLRMRLGELPATPQPVMVDTFDRQSTDGWGSTPTGQTYTDPFDEDTVTYSVDDGAGHHALGEIATAGNQITEELLPADMDATYSFSISDVPRGQANGAVYASLRVRTDPDTQEHHRMQVSVRADTGAVGGLLRVGTDISMFFDGSTTQLTPVGAPVPGLAYTPGQWLRVRTQCLGPILRMRVWADGEPEPQVWHTQAWDGRLTGDGQVGFRSMITSGASDTPTPLVVSYRDLAVRPMVDDPPVVRFSGEVTSWPTRWDVSDSDVWVPLPAAGIRRRLGQGAKPLRSPLRRVLPLHYPVAYWPLEDGADSVRAASPSPGVGALRLGGMDLAADDSLVSSGPLPTLGENARMISESIPSTLTGSWEVDMLYLLEEPDDPWDDYQRILSVHTPEYTFDLDVFYFNDRPTMLMTATSDAGTELESASVFIDDTAVTFFGAWRRLRVNAQQSGASTTVRWDRITPEGNLLGSDISFTADVGRVTSIATEFGPELEGMSIGHITVWGARIATGYTDVVDGFAGETARERMARLSAGADVPLEILGTAAEPLGPEPEGALLEVLAQAQEADLGVPGEDRGHLGLTYRGREELYNAAPALVLDYAAGEIAPPMEPEDDDQALRNDIEVSRSDGSSFQVEDTDGPLGVRRVGRYDESVTLNLASDMQVEAHAGWRLHLGTVDELRWPTIHLNMANPRMAARAREVLALDAGDRIRILNPPPWTQERALELIVQGYTETIGAFQWDLELTCTPASPWNPAVIGSEAEPPPEDAPARADTAGAELVFNTNATQTGMTVRTTQGPTWITTDEHENQFPFEIAVGGEVMRVLEISGDGPNQAFTVQRAINGVVKSHVSDTPVRLAHPAVTAL